MNAADSFSSSYGDARVKFLDAVLAHGGAILGNYRHPVPGLDGAELFTDVAWFGDRKAPRVAVIVSGTHGVEGFCGSGAQIDLARRGEFLSLPPDIAVVLVHAINPYGFAWLRRVTHENIDLNRNWVDFAAPLPTNPGYEALHPVLCPADWNEPTMAAGERAMAAYAAEHGAEGLRDALGAGQYEHKNGLYYGGCKSSWSRQVMTRIIDDFLAEAEAVSLIDYHSGLGPWGFAEPISTAPRASMAFRTARDWYGPALTSTADGSSSGAQISGDGLTGIMGLLGDRAVTGLVLEVGTIDRSSVRRALRADAWLHAYGDPLSPRAEGVRIAMRAAYYCETPEWQGMVAGQSLSAWRQTLAGLGMLQPQAKAWT